MKIIKAIPSDLIEILYLLRVCVLDMNEKGMKQWNNFYPEGSMMKKNLHKELIYLAKEKGVCKGMVTLTPDIPEDYDGTYAADEEKKTLYIQWLAVHPKWQQRGISKMLMDFAESFARKNGFTSILLDVLNNQYLVHQICQNNDYREIGKFHSSFQKIPYVCYKKEIGVD